MGEATLPFFRTRRPPSRPSSTVTPPVSISWPTHSTPCQTLCCSWQDHHQGRCEQGLLSSNLWCSLQCSKVFPSSPPWHHPLARLPMAPPQLGQHQRDQVLLPPQT